MAYRIIYSGVEVTKRGRGIIAPLHGELIEVDGLFVKSCGSSRLEAAKFETGGPQRSRQANRGRLIHAASWESFEAFASSQP